ncbi:MAG: hypothetical protein EXR75_08705 [Myxococcales bacterium]|nr:hypothetical protein [Myxococcales bacterium]
MTFSIQNILGFVVGALVYFGVLIVVERALRGRMKIVFRYAAIALTTGVFFYALQKYVPNHARAVELAKAAIAITAAGCVFYEQHRKGQERPIAERWKKIVGVTLALAAITAYFNGFSFGYPRYYHRWDQYHYYMGAKYFPELGYKNLYKCAAIAEDELGTLKVELDRPAGDVAAPTQVVDMRAEMRDPDKKVRDLPGQFASEFGGDNLLVPVQPILAHPEQCRDLFSATRWEAYKNDVAFFRVVSGKQYWTDMQKDHGFNPPPVWTIAGKVFSELAPTSVQFMQFLATLDLIYLAGMFIVLWWGFGWRVFAAGAIFWGCQSSAPFYWTGGAFLRQDWLFFSVLSVACIRRRHFKVAGAALVYAGLLRIFPGLVVIGTLVPVLAHVVEKRRMHADHRRMLVGGCLAAALLIPLSVALTAKDSYKTFFQHTIQTHDKTPLTNHMGLQVVVAHKFFEFEKPGIRSAEEREAYLRSLPNAETSPLRYLAPIRFPIRLATGKSSGQMEFVRDDKLTDPFKTWKDLRNERYAKYRVIAWAIVGVSLGFFIMVAHRIRSLWVAQCLGQLFVILLSQLTCYYYSFMILAAPLIRLRPRIEVGLYGLAAVTQIIWMNSQFNDNKYTLLTLVSLAFCYGILGLFWRREAVTSPALKDDEASPAVKAAAS